MFKAMFLLLLLSLTTSVAFQHLRINRMRTVFKAYIREFHKDYVGKNVQFNKERMAIFAKHYREVVKHNTEWKTSYYMEINKFSDMPNDELNKFMGLSNVSELVVESREKRVVKVAVPVPANVDHVANGLVTPVKNQEECGACWSFAAVGSFEGAYKNATGYLKSFSEQEALDCTYDDTRDGCAGGWYYDVYKYLKTHQRLAKYTDKPYKAIDETCTALSSNAIKNARFDGYIKVKAGDKTLELAASTHVVAVAVYATTMFPYRSGIFTGCPLYPVTVNHAVVLTGYSPLYWSLKNSWGKDWGENGYIRVSRAYSQKGCKITSYPYYPLVTYVDKGEKDEDDLYQEKNKVNVAQNGTADQSSTAYLGEAEHAIDGNNSTNFYTGHCSRTKIDFSNYWRVKLVQKSVISNVVVVLRSDLPSAVGDIDGATIHVGTKGSYWDKQCGSALHSSNIVNSTLTVNCKLSGNYVTVDLFSLKVRKAITLCEVMVFLSGSSDGCGSGMKKCNDGLCKPPSFC